ncbi:MAG: bifunctional 5,10-methylenetetrahydrofolate dehydrogenase/5,10-methenyltetrahydrofolate cyclohydrolase [Verrucomicrobiota bacterium]|nr:bifunctional 5,10-methylenetetrahydrofolate dehydrogenase/5,10-methenyltetrahydrofolate cyclohydrolase [Verrucomicrobiota bacterium]
MEIIDGKLVASHTLDSVKAEIIALGGLPPCVAFVRVGEDPASVFYVGSKQKAASRVGIESRLFVFPESITEAQLLHEVAQLNADPTVHGILVQSPLPKTISEQRIFDAIHPDKDVDGLNSLNQGLLCQEDERAFIPCTPLGVLELLAYYKVPTAGAHAVVVGRSVLVGKPAALLLMQKKSTANATVTLCHSRTTDLGYHTRQADILIAAIGRANTIRADMVKPGAVVIDVGINRLPDPKETKGYRIVGDVAFDEVSPICSRITPVPGGVGLMTVAMLMKNTLKAWKRSRGI